MQKNLFLERKVQGIVLFFRMEHAYFFAFLDVIEEIDEIEQIDEIEKIEQIDEID